MLRIVNAIGLAVSLTLAGCAWQQGYLAVQGWQRKACNRLVEQTERDRCLDDTNMTYDDYRRQTQGAKKD